jgi:hypothetical protein
MLRFYSAGIAPFVQYQLFGQDPAVRIKGADAQQNSHLIILVA